MGKNKLYKFNELNTFTNVFQCPRHELSEDNAVVQMAGKWNERYFHNANPIVLELGCGHGDYTIGLAKKYPEKNFIGIDIKGARLWKGAKEATMENIPNVAFMRIEIEMLAYFFAKDEVSEIWLTFPDPQMKKATKRLTSSYFMARYRQVLKSNGLIHLKTDSNFLYTYTQAVITENHFECPISTVNLYNEPDTPLWENARMLQTHYEKQWLQRGISIKYVCWKLNEGQYKEPDIEIEKDTYRSYGRNYVSTTNN